MLIVPADDDVAALEVEPDGRGDQAGIWKSSGSRGTGTISMGQVDARLAEAVGREAAGGDDEGSAAADAGPVLAGVEAEVAVGDAGEFPEGEDDGGDSRRQVGALERSEGEVDRPTSFFDSARAAR